MCQFYHFKESFAGFNYIIIDRDRFFRKEVLKQTCDNIGKIKSIQNREQTVYTFLDYLLFFWNLKFLKLNYLNSSELVFYGL